MDYYVAVARTHIGEINRPDFAETGKSWAIGVETHLGGRAGFRAGYGSAVFNDVEEKLSLPPGYDVECRRVTLGALFRF